MHCRLFLLLLVSVFLLLSPSLAARRALDPQDSKPSQNKKEPQPGIYHAVSVVEFPSRDQCANGMVLDKRTGQCRRSYIVA
ncbi:Hypothetical predicted protein [Cloeon dipterum]|uniref:Uncharacterized protein n=1 Tax=Cloeon dipterum TaxID=197152 RepID=A0A8S1E0I6_9INSE|nr:Hypothetical predicted protein [Cloeon dipterum]